MSEEVEQILDTAEESQTSTPQRSEKSVKAAKDPKKVAAGKALARKNAEARKVKEKEDDLSFYDVNYGIQAAAGIVGSGFVLYHGYKFYTNYNKSPPVTTTPGVAGSPAEELQTTPQPKNKKKKSNSIDME